MQWNLRQFAAAVLIAGLVGCGGGPSVEPPDDPAAPPPATDTGDGGTTNMEAPPLVE